MIQRKRSNPAALNIQIAHLMLKTPAFFKHTMQTERMHVFESAGVSATPDDKGR